MYIFVLNFYCFLNLSMLLDVTFIASHIPLCEYTMFCLSIHLLIDIWGYFPF